MNSMRFLILNLLKNRVSSFLFIIAIDQLLSLHHIFQVLYSDVPVHPFEISFFGRCVAPDIGVPRPISVAVSAIGYVFDTRGHLCVLVG